MTVNVSHTAEIQHLLPAAAAFHNDQSKPRNKAIMMR